MPTWAELQSENFLPGENPFWWFYYQGDNGEKIDDWGWPGHPEGDGVGRCTHEPGSLFLSRRPFRHRSGAPPRLGVGGGARVALWHPWDAKEGLQARNFVMASEASAGAS